jgi:hypothetical protein
LTDPVTTVQAQLLSLDAQLLDVDSKLAETVSVEDFGAVGDGVTDDTAAFSQALATKARVVCDGSKTYRVKELVIGGNEILDLAGATLKALDNTTRWVVKLDGFNAPTIKNGILDDSEDFTLRSVTLSGAVSAGGSSITVTDASTVEAGMVLAGPNTTGADIVSRRILSVVSNTITFEENTQWDLPNGGKMYGGYGVVTLMSAGDMRSPRIADMEVRGGAFSVFGHMGTTGDAARGFITNIYTTKPIVAHEYLGTGFHDTNRIGWEGWGSKTRGSTISATASQITINTLTHTGEIPMGRVYKTSQISVKIDGVAQTVVTGAPSAGQVKASSDGLTLTLPSALSGGEQILVNVFDKSMFGILQDAHGASLVSGAHKWIRCLFIETHAGALFDSTNDDAGLMHMNMVHLDGQTLYNMKLIATNKFYGTHVFCGFANKALICTDFDAARRVHFNGLWTNTDTSLNLNPTQTAASSTLTLNNVALNTSDGKPNIVLDSWWGPDFDTSGSTDLITTGPIASVPMRVYDAISQYGDGSDFPSFTQRASSGSFATPTATANNDVVGQWQAQAHNGTDYQSVANMRFVANQTHSGSAAGTDLETRVTQAGQTTPVLAQTLTVSADGFVRMKATASDIIFGSGSPEGVVTATVGSMFLRSDGGAGTSMYIKESGASNTGWVGK